MSGLTSVYPGWELAPKEYFCEIACAPAEAVMSISDRSVRISLLISRSSRRGSLRCGGRLTGRPTTARPAAGRTADGAGHRAAIVRRARPARASRVKLRVLLNIEARQVVRVRLV